MTAVNQRGRVILSAGTAADDIHDFLGGDFLVLADSGAEVFFASLLGAEASGLSVLEGAEELSAVFAGEDSLFLALSAALLYPSLR